MATAKQNARGSRSGKGTRQTSVACLACRKWHSSCRPTYVWDKEEGKERLSTCERCQKRETECIYAKRRKRPERSGPRIEEARSRFQTSHNPFIVEKRQSVISSTTTIGRQDVLPSSCENRIRGHQRRGALVFDLIRCFLNGVHIGFVIESSAFSTIRRWGIVNLTKAFEANGLHLNGENLGPHGDLHLAILCAAGASLSSHSAILGLSPSKFTPLPAEWSSFDGIWDDISKPSPFHLPSNLDLRYYGLARQKPQQQLWRYCWNVFERNGFFDEGRKFEISELKIFEQFRALVCGISDEDMSFLCRIALKMFKTIPIGGPGGWKSRSEKMDFFDGFLAADMLHSVLNCQVPVISDEDILEIMADPHIDPKIFLSFDRKAVPTIWDWYSHHQIVWATYLSVERMMAVAAHSIMNQALIDPEIALLQLYSVIKERESWRRSTILEESKPDSTTTRKKTKTILMTPYGPEDSLITSLDESSNALCHFTLLRLLEQVGGSVESSPALKALKVTCLGVADSEIKKLASVKDSETLPPFLIKRKLRSLEALPGGSTYLIGYLSRAEDEREIFQRSQDVNRILEWCKLLSFTGQRPLWQLLDLENALTLHSLQARRNEIILSGSDVGTIMEQLIQGALKDVLQT